MNRFDEEYLGKVKTVLAAPQRRGRNGTTRSTFGLQMKFDFKHGFPALTVKKLLFEHVKTELAWMLTGSQNIAFLKERKCNIWNEWADEEGNLGPVYGVQWRKWGGDQIAEIERQLRVDPFSRRIILSAWNVADVPEMRLPPCPAFAQFYVDAMLNLHCHLYQRSGDLFLGVPFNIASYSLLTQVLAKRACLGSEGSLTVSYGDLHLYENHVQQAQKILDLPSFPPPQVLVPDLSNLVEQVLNSRLENYTHGPFVGAPVSV